MEWRALGPWASHPLPPFQVQAQSHPQGRRFLSQERPASPHRVAGLLHRWGATGGRRGKRRRRRAKGGGGGARSLNETVTGGSSRRMLEGKGGRGGQEEGESPFLELKDLVEVGEFEGCIDRLKSPLSVTEGPLDDRHVVVDLGMGCVREKGGGGRFLQRTRLQSGPLHSHTGKSPARCSTPEGCCAWRQCPGTAGSPVALSPSSRGTRTLAGRGGSEGARGGGGRGFALNRPV